jgi:hypothetical protein
MTTHAPLTERQEKVLLVLLADQRPMAPNDIGYALRLPPVYRKRGPWAGMMGPAQRVIGTLFGLWSRGLIQHAERSDGLSGTAYLLTDAGTRAATALSGGDKR